MNSGGGSIFDDFLGFGAKKEESKNKKEPKKTIEVDENLMIETISDVYCH